MRSASLDARTFAFTPSTRVPMRGRYYEERERERERTTIIPGLEPNRRDRRACAMQARHIERRALWELVSLPRRCCEQRLIPIDLFVITRRLWGGGGKKRGIPRETNSFLVLWYRGIWISTPGSSATYILYPRIFPFYFISSLSFLLYIFRCTFGILHVNVVGIVRIVIRGV